MRTVSKALARGVAALIAAAIILSAVHAAGASSARPAMHAALATTAAPAPAGTSGPALHYATFASQAADAQGRGVAVDRAGNAYVVGSTGVGQTSRLFVTKLDPTGAHILFTTSISAPCGAVGNAIAVDAAGNAYVTGQYGVMNTYNICLITTDVLVAKIDPAGHIMYQNAIGPSSKDFVTISVNNQGEAIAVDRSGAAYVTGRADALLDDPSIPTTADAYQRTGHIHDGFVLKLDPAGHLAYSTFLGGSDLDEGRGIAVDGAGNAYVTGSTQSADFPVTPGAFQRHRGTYFGSSSAVTGNAFVAELNAAGSALLYGTYLGGGIADSGSAIAADGAGNVYVTGMTGSPNFPTTPGAFDRTCGTNGRCNFAFVCAVGCGNVYPDDLFVTKLSVTQSGAAALRYSTFLGGRGEDQGLGIAVDRGGRVWVAGLVSSMDGFPTVQPVQAALAGKSDACVVELDPARAGAQSLLFSTYLGGGKDDGATALALGPSSVYVAGYSYSTDFPTRRAVLGAKAGRFGAFVARLTRHN